MVHVATPFVIIGLIAAVSAFFFSLGKARGRAEGTKEVGEQFAAWRANAIALHPDLQPPSEDS